MTKDQENPDRHTFVHLWSFPSPSPNPPSIAFHPQVKNTTHNNKKKNRIKKNEPREPPGHHRNRPWPSSSCSWPSSTHRRWRRRRCFRPNLPWGYPSCSCCATGACRRRPRPPSAACQSRRQRRPPPRPPRTPRIPGRRATSRSLFFLLSGEGRGGGGKRDGMKERWIRVKVSAEKKRVKGDAIGASTPSVALQSERRQASGDGGRPWR